MLISSGPFTCASKQFNTDVTAQLEQIATLQISNTGVCFPCPGIVNLAKFVFAFICIKQIFHNNQAYSGASFELLVRIHEIKHNFTMLIIGIFNPVQPSAITCISFIDFHGYVFIFVQPGSQNCIAMKRILRNGINRYYQQAQKTQNK